MDPRLKILTAVLVASVFVLAPFTAGEGDADSHGQSRFSDMYLLKANVVMEEDHYISGGVGAYAFYNGSENDAMMDRYIEDPQDMSVSIVEGDLPLDEGSVSLYRGNDLNVYTLSYTPDPTLWFLGNEYEASVVLEPYGQASWSVYVESGNTVSISVETASNRGEGCDIGFEYPSGSSYGSYGKFSETMYYDCYVSFYVDGTDWKALYYDVSYVVTGDSEPLVVADPVDGITAFMAAFLVIGIACIALVVYAGRGPRWSK